MRHTQVLSLYGSFCLLLLITATVFVSCTSETASEPNPTPEQPPKETTANPTDTPLNIEPHEAETAETAPTTDLSDTSTAPQPKTDLPTAQTNPVISDSIGQTADTTSAPIAPADPLDNFTGGLNLFLAEFTDDGLVNYAGIKSNSALLDSLMILIAEMSLEGRNQSTETAFRINAYNVATIAQIVEHYPVNSPQDIKGFWREQEFTIAGARMTLNDLENNHLRFDPRLHFVLVCAAKGCPPLADYAYTAANLEASLQTQTKLALNDPALVEEGLDKDGNRTLILTQIFEWYAEDFGGKGQFIHFINKYRQPPVSGVPTIKFSQYNWELNDWNRPNH